MRPWLEGFLSSTSQVKQKHIKHTGRPIGTQTQKRLKWLVKLLCHLAATLHAFSLSLPCTFPRISCPFWLLWGNQKPCNKMEMLPTQVIPLAETSSETGRHASRNTCTHMQAYRKTQNTSKSRDVFRLVELNVRSLKYISLPLHYQWPNQGPVSATHY